MSDCLFCKIVAGQIPANKVYEDEDVLAFHDIRPIAPVHFMIIPKRHVDSLAHCGPSTRRCWARF
ncbi:purine nucleoside phosphoramidase [Chromobacterium vaccinii]|nr:purine nucleoside phosphoramidase [Chromobacterium vaccinii]